MTTTWVLVFAITTGYGVALDHIAGYLSEAACRTAGAMLWEEDNKRHQWACIPGPVYDN